MKRHNRSVQKVRIVTGYETGERLVTHCPVTGDMLPESKQYTVKTVTSAVGRELKRGGSSRVRHHKRKGQKRTESSAPLSFGFATKIVMSRERRAEIAKEKAVEKAKDGASVGLKGKLSKEQYPASERYNKHTQPAPTIVPADAAKVVNGRGWRILAEHYNKKLNVYMFKLSNGEFYKVVQVHGQKNIKDARMNCKLVHGCQ
jgi:hypothetical protein